MLGRDGNGRYPRLIGREFMTDMVMAGEPKRNMVCRCETDTFMVCRIFVKPDSLEEAAVVNRLDRTDRERLLPFFEVTQTANSPSSSDSDLEPSLMFADSSCDPPVLCQIIVEHQEVPAVSNTELADLIKPKLQKSQSDGSLPSLIRPPLPRTLSSPSRSKYPTRAIPLRLCTDDICPITQNKLGAHDIVYVLKTDAEQVISGNPVPCISAYGLKKLAMESGGTFPDPLRRLDGEKTSISRGYHAYVVVENTGEACSLSSLESAPSGTAAGPSNPHSDPGLSSGLVGDDPGPSSAAYAGGDPGPSSQYPHPMYDITRDGSSSDVASRDLPRIVDVQAHRAPPGPLKGIKVDVEGYVDSDDEQHVAMSEPTSTLARLGPKLMFILYMLALFHFIFLSFPRPTAEPNEAYKLLV